MCVRGVSQSFNVLLCMIFQKILINGMYTWTTFTTRQSEKGKVAKMRTTLMTTNIIINYYSTMDDNFNLMTTIK